VKRPTSVTVFGVLNLVFGFLGICGVAAGALSFAIPQNPDMPNPVMEIMATNVVYSTFTKVSLGCSAIATLVLIAAGIGLLGMKPWGRMASIGYGIYAIVMGLVGLVINAVYVSMPLMQQASEMQGPEAAGAIGGAIGGVVGGCIGLVYPALLLFFMTRPNVVQAFEQPQGELTI
jgi:hypothetical protein